MHILDSAEEAVGYIKSGDNVFVHTAACIPRRLVDAMAQRAHDLKDVTIYQLHTEGDAPYAEEACGDAFHVRAFFVGASTRKAIQCERGSYIPIFLSEVPLLFRTGKVKLNVALVSVSPPDRHGYCSLGPSVDIARAAVESAGTVIAQINRFMPRSHGDGLIHIDNLDYVIHGDVPLPEAKDHELTEVEKKIGENIAELIEDGATLQMGIGAIPNAVLACLGNHKNLGIHSEMFSDGILPLVEKGVINGSKKIVHPGTIVGSFTVGGKALYDFIDDNPVVKMLESDYVNKVDVIRRNPKVVAINSAIEVDLTGQVCADSIGNKIYSGVGGQMDFIRGASMSEGGKPVIALPSVTKSGMSKIVPNLKQGAGVVTTRAHVHYIVTEYGAVNLYGKSIEQRIELLTSIAHPDHREMLQKEAVNMLN